MKKYLTKASAIILVITLATLASISVMAETVYENNDLLYTIVNNYSVSIYGCNENVTELVLPLSISNRDVVDIRNRAFYNNESITKVDFYRASSLERIGMFAFKGCNNLGGSITFPASLSLIEVGAFEDCTSLESVRFNSPFSEIPSQCFNRCTSLSSVNLNNDLDSIESYAFADCPNLTYVTIPGSVTYIANSAFLNDNVTLGVYYDTYAHHYAIGKDINYEILDPENIPTEPPTDSPTEAPTEPPTEPEPEGYFLGDTDDNDDVEVVDATWLQRYIALMNIGVIEDTVMQGDVDGDGDPSIVDATFIMRYCVGIDTPFDIGELVV